MYIYFYFCFFFVGNLESKLCDSSVARFLRRDAKNLLKYESLLRYLSPVVNVVLVNFFIVISNLS